MKQCHFPLEALLGIPIDYENWHEDLTIELTDEQFYRYCETFKHWISTDEWKNWNDENGHDFFIKRDLPDIYALVWEKLVEQAPKIWDERIVNYLDQVNIYTADEIWEVVCEW